MIGFSDYYVDLSDPAAHQLMISRLTELGIFTFAVPTPKARQELLQLALKLGKIHRHAHSDADGVTVILPMEEITDLPGLLGFSRHTLDLHTDCTALPVPPDLIVNHCGQAAIKGGETLLVDMKEVYEELLHSWPGVAQDLSGPGSMIFGFGRGRYAGSVFEHVGNNRILCRFRADGAGFSDVRIGTSMQILMDLLERYCVKLKLESGQGYVINNGRWLHGRSSFVGHREFMRILVNAHDPAVPSYRISRGFDLSYRTAGSAREEVRQDSGAINLARGANGSRAEQR